MTTRRRAAWIAAGALLLIALVVGVIAWQSSDDDTASGAPGASAFVSGLTSARAPYRGYATGSLRVGDATLTVVIADDDAKRSQGLRGRPDAAPYDGMVFVWPEDTRSAFTMAGVPGALDLGFYDASGAKVGRLLMQPCPSGTDATCPIYQIDQRFRYALETAAGQLPAGSLRQP